MLTSRVELFESREQGRFAWRQIPHVVSNQAPGDGRMQVREPMGGRGHRWTGAATARPRRPRAKMDTTLDASRRDAHQPTGT